MLKFAWPGVQWNEALLKTTDPLVRVGILVCLLGASGEDFLRTLHLPKEPAQAILGAWKIAQEQMCPLAAPLPLQREILQAVLPSLPEAALEPCFVRGGELKDLGLAGRRISGALDRVRKAQFTGKIKNREEALEFFDHVPSIKRKIQTLYDVGLSLYSG